VLIQVGVGGDVLTLEFEDDGVGFDPGSVRSPDPSGRGLGLLGLRERMELVGGTAEVDSEPGQGTRVSLRVPLDRVREAA
jgi:signal transduction histidine kinase